MEYSMPLGNLLDVINDFIESNDEFSYEEIIELLNNHTIELNCVEDDDDFLCSLLEEISEDSEEEDEEEDEEDEEDEDDEDNDDDDKF
jgi:hypothetical protein